MSQWTCGSLSSIRIFSEADSSCSYRKYRKMVFFKSMMMFLHTVSKTIFYKKKEKKVYIFILMSPSSHCSPLLSPQPSTHQHPHLHYFVDKDLTDANRQQKSALLGFKIILYHVPNPPTISPSCLVKNMLRYQPEMHLNLPWKLWLVNFTF